MTGYKELCNVFFEEEPRRIAIERILRELPMTMRQAISDYLAAPTGIAAMPTILFDCQTLYVDLYRPLIDKFGARTWERCEVDHNLWFDHDGMPWFGIGIYIEKTPGALTTSMSMIHFTFCVEAFDEQSLELRIENLDGSIPIKNAHDRASYAGAAKLAIDRIMPDLRNATAGYGSRTPIGFINLQAQ
jgi:hypothetical protein